MAANGIMPELRVRGAIRLKTHYGDPLSQDYPDGAIGIAGVPKRTFDYEKVFNPAANLLCYAKPLIEYGSGNYAGPAYMWDVVNGFIPQSRNPSGYGLNFPTTGASDIYFDLIVAGMDATKLTWSTIEQGRIKVTPSIINSGVVRIMLTGPKATKPSPSSPNQYVDGATAVVPTLPSTFEITGKRGGTTKVSYGFVLKQWFVNRGSKTSYAVTGSYVNPDGISYINHNAWCNKLNGSSYRLPKLNELTNATGMGTPGAGENNYKRHIGAGLFAEWGGMYYDQSVGFEDYYWTADTSGSYRFLVYSGYGSYDSIPDSYFCGLCVTP